jgi:hypothetical protein
VRADWPMRLQYLADFCHAAHPDFLRVIFVDF